MKQKSNIDVSRLKEILERSKMIQDNMTASPFGFTQDVSNIPTPEPTPEPKKRLSVMGEFLAKVKSFWVITKNFFGKKKFVEPIKKVVVETETEKAIRLRNEIKEKYNPQHFVKDFEGKFNTNIDNINRVMDLFPSEMLDSNLPMYSSGGNVGGHKAPLYYEPLFVDIHNELCEEVNSKTLDELKKSEEALSEQTLNWQDINPKGMKGSGLRGKFDVIQTDFFKKKEAIKKIKQTFNTIGIESKVEDGLNYYRRGVSEVKKDEIRAKLLTNVKAAEDEQVNKYIGKK